MLMLGDAVEAVLTESVLPRVAVSGIDALHIQTNAQKRAKRQSLLCQVFLCQTSLVYAMRLFAAKAHHAKLFLLKRRTDLSRTSQDRMKEA